MATQIQLRRGTTVQHSTFTGASAEITFDTDKTTVVTHDGSTVGGFPLATETQVNDRIQVANANATFVTKAIAVSSNNALVNLINDRLQIANATATYSTLAQLGNTNSYIAAESARIDLLNTNLTSTNTAIRSLISSNDTDISNLQAEDVKLWSSITSTNTAIRSAISTEVSNLVDSAPETLNTLNELAAALGDDANFATTTATTLGTKAANTYVNQTFVTKSTALSSNTAQNVLINDRIQVANARVEFLQSSNTTITNDASSITTAMNSVDLNDNALVNPAGFITLNIGGVNYKLPFFS